MRATIRSTRIVISSHIPWKTLGLWLKHNTTVKSDVIGVKYGLPL
jgi:hypothetical protein